MNASPAACLMQCHTRVTLVKMKKNKALI